MSFPNVSYKVIISIMLLLVSVLTTGMFTSVTSTEEVGYEKLSVTETIVQTVKDIVNIFTTETVEGESELSHNNQMEKLVSYLQNGTEVTEEFLLDTMTRYNVYFAARIETTDFRTVSMMVVLYDYYDELYEISPEAMELFKQTLLDFKYWMTEPGEDSMCYWSENHQMLFACAEYLVGQYWPDEIFTNDGKTGLEHMQTAQSRIEAWLSGRYYYGFSEYASSTYMKFSMAPLANFIMYSQDDDLVEQAKMVMDIAIYDLATNTFEGVLEAPTTRAYADNLGGTESDRMSDFIDYIFYGKINSTTNGNLTSFVMMCQGTDENGEAYYEIPSIMQEIFEDTDTAEIKYSSSLTTAELAEFGFVGMEDYQIMMQFGMGSYTSPETIHNAFSYFDEYNLYSNETFELFKYFNIEILTQTGILDYLTAEVGIMTNGIAMSRGNIYTYQTEYYQFATNQMYDPGSYGASQFLSVANFTDYAVVFTAHPAQEEASNTVSAYPGYWAGYGRAPAAAQDENIQLSIYQIPYLPGALEMYDVPDFTHTYLPEAFFDEVIIDGNYAFATVDGAYIALIANGDLYYNEFNLESAKALGSGVEDYPEYCFDLIQEGNNQFWIYELGDETTDETFEEFIYRIKSNEYYFDGKSYLEYTSNGKTLTLDFDGDFTVDGEVMDLDYERYDSPYAYVERYSDDMYFEFGGETLYTNFVTGERTYS